jgi:hypothetical protein
MEHQEAKQHLSKSTGRLVRTIMGFWLLILSGGLIAGHLIELVKTGSLGDIPIGELTFHVFAIGGAVMLVDLKTGEALLKALPFFKKLKG